MTPLMQKETSTEESAWKPCVHGQVALSTALSVIWAAPRAARERHRLEWMVVRAFFSTDKEES